MGIDHETKTLSRDKSQEDAVQCCPRNGTEEVGPRRRRNVATTWSTMIMRVLMIQNVRVRSRYQNQDDLVSSLCALSLSASSSSVGTLSPNRFLQRTPASCGWTPGGSIDVSDDTRGGVGGYHITRGHLHASTRICGVVFDLTFGSMRFQYGLARSSFASATTGAFELSPWPDRLRLSMHAQMASHRPSHESSSP